MAEPSRSLQWSRLRRALGFARAHRWFVVFVLVMTLMVAGANALEPLVMKYIFDRLELTATAFQAVIAGVGMLLGLALLREIASAVSNWLTWRIRLNLHHGLLDATIERLYRMPAYAQRKEGVGAVMTRLDRGIQGFIGAVTQIAFNVLPAIAYLVLAVISMLTLDWRMTLLVLAFSPLPAVIAALAAPTQTRREQDLMDRWARIYARFNEVLSGLTTVRSFAMEDVERRRFIFDVGAANRVVIRGVGFDTGVGALQNTIITLARIAAIGFGGWLVVNGELTVGSLVAFLGYVGGLFGPVQGLTGIYRTLHNASVALDQVFTILDAEDHLPDAPDAVDAPPFRGRVDFDNVHFAYGPDEGTVLQGLDLHVEPGETVALVGPSGAGKSTLMALLQRFNDPIEGRVRIDGTDLRRFKQRSVREQIGVVLQEALLFNESVRDNIAYGKPDASLEEVQQAARWANADTFIRELDAGYDTVLGERGGRLSGGQRQRIAIARALLKNPPILVLDEATSALDPEVEAKVQEALDRLIKGRTTFIIAHRLSTVVNADRILVLRDGRIQESGSHQELLVQGGYYASMVARQTQGLLPTTPLVRSSQPPWEQTVRRRQ